MARSLASPVGTSRIAVIGAVTPEGVRLREALVSRRIPGAQVDLFAVEGAGESGEEIVLSEYAGEARLVPSPSVSDISAHDIIFLCEPGETALELVRLGGRRAITIDLTGSLPADLGSTLVHLDLNPEVLADHRGFVTVADPIAGLIAELLLPISRVAPIARSVATVLRPALDFGDAGVDELREQTVRLLNFNTVPTDVFGRQLAFNVIPQALLPGSGPDPERRIAQQAGRLLGPAAHELAVTMAAVPVFHGHHVFLHVGFVDGFRMEDVREALDASRFGDFRRTGTVLDITGESGAGILAVEEDGAAGCRVKVVVADLGAVASTQAVRIAEALSRP